MRQSCPVNAEPPGLTGHAGVAELKDLRLAVYRSFAEHGWAPDVAPLPVQLNGPQADVVRGGREPARLRHWAIEDRGGADVRGSTVVTRHDPSESANYLRSVGLSGPFWGLGAARLVRPPTEAWR